MAWRGSIGPLLGEEHSDPLTNSMPLYVSPLLAVPRVGATRFGGRERYSACRARAAPENYPRVWRREVGEKAGPVHIVATELRILHHSDNPFLMSELPPLPSDPRRQACDMLGAVAYQIWQSVLAWVTLKEDEILYLEGAEDFDKITENSGEAIQVHRSRGRISLRTKKVIEAFNNFWSLQEQTDLVVTLRFLSTAETRVESGAPFGHKNAGLDILRQRQVTDSQARQIADFLLESEKVTPSLKEFLKDGTPESLKDRLFSRIHWDLGAQDSGGVERAVSEKLECLGAKHGLTCDASSRVCAHLFKVAFEVASNRHSLRALRFLDFMREFEKATSELVSTGLLRRLEDLATDPLTELQSGVPPLPIGTLARTGLLDEIQAVLESFGVICLWGPPGMAKTTMAQLVAQRIKSDWRWMGFKQRGPHDTESLLHRLGRAMDRDTRIGSIVLEDLDFRTENARVYEGALASIINRIKSQRGLLVLTSQNLPLRLVANAWLSSKEVIQMPRLQKDELATWATSMGCPDMGMAQRWADVAFDRTRGHPQLAHALLSDKSARNWPPVTADDYEADPDQVREIKEDARQLASQLPADERDLIYRLSLIKGFFRREHAIELGGALSPISVPGAAFNRLQDIWIDRAESGYFRVSPLIIGAAENEIPHKQVRDLHLAIADAVKTCEPKTSIEAGLAFRHLWQARDKDQLLGLALSLLDSDRDTFGYIAQELSWFISEAPVGKMLFPEHETISNLLRLLQARVAVHNDRSMAARVFDAWHTEEYELVECQDVISKLLLTTNALNYFEVKIPAGRLIGYLVLLHEAEQTIAGFRDNLLPEASELGWEKLKGVTDSVTLLAMMSVSRCDSIGFLTEMMGALDTVPSTLRQRIIAGMRLAPMGFQSLFTKLWYAEVDSTAPDWEAFILTLKKAYELGKIWGELDFAAEAIIGVSMAYDEQLGDQTMALCELGRGMMDLGIDYPRLKSQEAVVLFHQGKNKEALDIWDRVLCGWAPDDPLDLSPSMAARLAAMAAAKLGAWENAGNLFLLAASHAQEMDEVAAVGFLADAGFSFWKAGAAAESLQAFSEGVKIARTFPVGKSNLRAFRARLILEYVICWVHNEIYEIPPENQQEPIVGGGSAPDLYPRVAELPEGKPESLYVLLFRVIVKLGPQSEFPGWLKYTLESLVTPSARALYRQALVCRALDKGEVNGFPRLHAEYLQAFCDAGAPGVTPGRFDPAHSEFGANLYILAMVSDWNSPRGFNALLDAWKESSRLIPFHADLHGWFDFARVWLSFPLETSADYLRAGNITNIERILSALRVASEPGTNAGALLRAHCALFVFLSGFLMFPFVERAFSDLVVTGWRAIARRLTQTSHGEINFSGLLEAFDSKAVGKAKASLVIQSATSVLRMRLDQQLAAFLREHRASNL